MPDEILMLITFCLVATVLVTAALVYGWVHTTKLKIRHGYPLQSMWGQPLRPSTSAEAEERVSLLTHENAQLKAQVGSMRERLETVERIVTDGGYGLTHEIERLRDGKGKVQ